LSLPIIFGPQVYRLLMTPIHELLKRIVWDQEFGRGQFEIGFSDRHQDTLQRIALQGISFPSDEPNAFELVDESGQPRRIPLHRIREVYRDKQLIWQRPMA
jgi:uncharacterized protein (UPF0248 family)